MLKRDLSNIDKIQDYISKSSLQQLIKYSFLHIYDE